MAYLILQNVHLVVGSLVLLIAFGTSLALLMGGTLSRNTLAFRTAEGIATLQFLLGATLVVWLLVAAGTGAALQFWLHYALGLVTLRLFGVAVSRALRAEGETARRAGLLMLGVLALAVATFAVGYYRFTV